MLVIGEYIFELIFAKQTMVNKHTSKIFTNSLVQ